MCWPINHMVAPAKDALRCTVCHFRGGDNRLNWKALGYDEDPVREGGRFVESLQVWDGILYNQVNVNQAGLN